MKELDALSNQIISRTKEEGQKKLAKKETELNAKLEESRLRFVEFQKTQKALIQSRNQAEYERQVQSLHNEKRNALLAEKQNILASIYDGAVEKMSNWDAKTLQSFAEKVLQKFEGQEVNVVAGEKTAPLLDERFKAKHPAVTFSSETVAGKAGFIVEVGGIDYNYLFDQIVAEIKKDFTPKLASLAFQINE